MKRMFFAALFTAAVFMAAEPAQAAKKPAFEGYKKCGGCHKSQKDSWLDTKHAKAFDLLKPNVAEKEKKKAKLDPAKDYTSDEKCVGCHVTGYKKQGGYTDTMPETKAKYYVGVGCEDCHGAGSLYRKEHSKAGNAFKKSKEKTPRQDLVDAGQHFDYQDECNRCHMNYKGSAWKDAEEPYTPFTPQVDAKYKFDYDKAVKMSGKGKGMHEHFKLRGVFEGEPIPKIRAEFQKNAKEPAAGEEEKEE